MNEPRKSELQFSVSALLAFVVAVGIWFLVATRAGVLNRQYITVSVVVVGTVCAVVAYRKRKRALTLLISLFLFAVLGSHSALRYWQLRDLELREKRLLMLEAYQRAMLRFNVDMRDWLPSGHLMESGAALYRAIGGKGPSTEGFVSTTVNNVKELRGADGGRLLWARNQNGEYVLVDLGPDNLLGGTVNAAGVFLRTEKDSNDDVIDDGTDDVVQDFQVWIGTE